MQRTALAIAPLVVTLALACPRRNSRHVEPAAQPVARTVAPPPAAQPLPPEPPPPEPPPPEPSVPPPADPTPAPVGPVGESPIAWAGAFFAYPGGVDICWSHSDHGGGRDFINVFGTADSREKVLRFYDARYPNERSGFGYSKSEVGAQHILRVYTLAEAREKSPCRGKTITSATVIVIESSVAGPPEPLDF